MSESEYDAREAGNLAARRVLGPIQMRIVRILVGCLAWVAVVRIALVVGVVLVRMALVVGGWQLEWFCFRVKWLPFTLKLFTLSDPEADYFYEERRRLIENKGRVVIAKLDELEKLGS